MKSFKKYFNVIRERKKTCESLCCEYIHNMGKDVLEYDQKSKEFQYLFSVYVRFLNRFVKCVDKAKLSLSLKKIEYNILVLQTEYNEWQGIIARLQEHAYYSVYTDIRGNGQINQMVDTIQGDEI